VVRVGWVGRSATEIATAVRESRVTAREVVDAHLTHLAAVDGKLGAFVSVRAGAARREADAVDAREDRFALPLAGVPVAIKDVADVSGEATRHGSRALPEDPVEYDAPEVTRLRKAGAIVLGKTRCPELSLWGTSDDVDGIAVNPWDPTRTAGGSSGGSAAAVAAGVVPIALASDGLGSVRIPAAATGCVGIKPGAGHLPVMVDGRHHWFGLSRYGPVTTTVGDLALALDVLTGGEQLRDPAVPVGVKVAVSWKPAAAGVAVGRPWAETAIEAGRVLRHLGHDVTHDDPPYDGALLPALLARWTQGAAQDIETLGCAVEQLQPRTRAHADAGRRLGAALEVEDAQADAWRERTAPFFDRHDVLVTPMCSRTPPKAIAWHDRPWALNVAANLSAYPFTSAWNLADLPAAAVPLGTHRGRPLSVQVVARQGREDLVLGVARALEETVGWRRHAPGWGVLAA
jgi:amidase